MWYERVTTIHFSFSSAGKESTVHIVNDGRREL